MRKGGRKLAVRPALHGPTAHIRKAGADEAQRRAPVSGTPCSRPRQGRLRAVMLPWALPPFRSRHPKQPLLPGNLPPGSQQSADPTEEEGPRYTFTVKVDMPQTFKITQYSPLEM